MTRAENDSDAEELLESCVVAFDEAIAGGETLFADLPPLPTVRAEAEGLKQCLLLLETARRDGTLTGILAAPAQRDTLDTIDQIGRFEIIREIGRGGYGVVFLAYDPRLERNVALKVPRPESLLVAGLRERFLREARATAALAHPNIVPVYETGEDGPLCYLAAEFCDGPTLAQWLSQQVRPVAIRDAVRLVMTIADAVHHAHERGIVHRDIKPSNVLLDPGADWDDGDYTAVGELCDFVPKLTDFGLARLVDEATAETRSGAMLGTPRYMAPEQVEGRRQDVGPRTDVYALGVILYELLAGQPPYDGPNQTDVLRKIVSEEPPSLRPRRRDIPRDLVAMVLCCLERSPARRYESAHVLAADLRRFLHGQPTLARPLSPAGRLVKSIRRRPALSALAIVCAATPFLWLAILTRDNVRLSAAVELAQTKQQEALSAGEVAGRKERERRREAYPAEMKLAFDAHGSGDLDTMRRLLESYIPAPGEEDLRGWEWYFLWRIAHTPCRTLEGHAGAVYFVSFSPDGSQLATAGKDHTIKLWDFASGKGVATLTGHTDEVNSVVYSPDGKLLASASDDGTVRIWDTRTRNEVHRISGHGVPVICVRFTPAQDQLVSGDRLGLIKIWSTSDWRHLADLTGHTKAIESLAISSDGRTVISACSADMTVRHWDLTSRQEERCFAVKPYGVQSVSPSPDGQTWAAGTIDTHVMLWKVGEQTAQWTRGDHAAPVETVAFAPDGRSLASAGRQGRIIIHDADSSGIEGTIWAHAERIWCLAYSPDGKTLASTSADSTVRLWDLASSLPRYRVGYSVTPDHAALSSDGRRVVVRRGGSDDLAILDTISGRELAELAANPFDGNAALAFTPDGCHLAVGCADSAIRFYDFQTRQESFAIRLPAEGRPRRIMFSDDGARMAVQASQEISPRVPRPWTFSVWDVAARRVLYNSDLGSSFLSHDGRHVAVMLPTADHAIEIREVDGALPVARLATGTHHGIHNIVFSSTGMVAFTLGDGTLRLWNWRNNAPPLVRMNATFSSRPMCFSPDGTTLATTLHSGVVLWNVATGQKLWTMAGATGSSPYAYLTKKQFSSGFVPQIIRFTADGRSLVAWGNNDEGSGSFCRWDAASPETQANRPYPSR